MIPVAAVQALASFEGIEKVSPFLRQIMEVKFIKSSFQGFLPGLGLEISYSTSYYLDDHVKR
jgi:lysine-specific demethylase 3